MSDDTIGIPESGKPSVTERIAEAARHAAHASHEARMVKSLAEDAIDDSVHAARRAILRGIERLEDVKDDGIHHAKRQPVRTVTTAAAVGLVVGLAAGWIGARFSSKRARRP